MKKVNSIKSGLLKRNSALLKFSLKAGINLLKYKDKPNLIIENLIGKDVNSFVNEISNYKGSITKAGQILSQYGEYFLSPQINNQLKKLQSKNHYIDFEKLKSQIPKELLGKFIFDPVPIAAASIGQVHIAKNIQDNKDYAFKIQYLGIEKAISADMMFLKLFINSLKLVPKGIDITDSIKEIENLLKNEMDYYKELKTLQIFKKLCIDKSFYVPNSFKEYSSRKILCMEYVKGTHLSNIEELRLNQEKLDQYALSIFKLFLDEIFIYKYIQTDVHGGNFLINNDTNQLILLDFGAYLNFDSEVLNFYCDFLKYSYLLDEEKFFECFDNFIIFTKKPLKYEKNILWDYIKLISSPLRSDNYHWGKTQLPDELLTEGKKLWKTLKFKSVATEFMFLDKKVIGLFSILKSLNSTVNVKSLFIKYI